MRNFHDELTFAHRIGQFDCPAQVYDMYLGLGGIEFGVDETTRWIMEQKLEALQCLPTSK